jgi:cysteinyl-tRNA synthetase
MESASGKKPLVNYWMHTGFLTINGQKMSKSLGNFITIHELLREYSKETFRLFVLSSHYKSLIDYQENALEQAKANVQRLGEFYQKISAKATESETVSDSSYPPSPRFRESEAGLRKSGDKARFYEELDNDFNTPKALANLFELVREGNALLDKKKLDKDIANSFLKFLNEINSIFGIIPEVKAEQIPNEVISLANKREKLRRENKWQEADNIRIEIEKLGYIIEDTPEGPKLKLKA